MARHDVERTMLTQAGALGLRRAATNGRLDADSLTVAGATQRSTYGYDAHGALNQLTARRNADTLFATSYVRDSLSRITQLTERVNGTTQVVAFTYDAVGRLSTVTRNGTLTASYTYDLNGNRATKTTSGGTVTATVDDQDRLVSYGGATYAYTAHGDLRRKIAGTDTTEYTYDALGNLTQMRLPTGTRVGYLIDAMNRRIGQTVNDTLVKAWLYQGQLTPVAELDGAGQVVSRFVYATGVNVPDYVVQPGAGGDSTYRVIRDHLGSVRLVLNVASGTIIQRIAYDEFGIETENTNPGWQPFGYAGGLTDSQTGLVRFGARDYDPIAGRWMAKDPIGFAGGAFSLYEYAANDPVNFADPSGHCTPADGWRDCDRMISAGESFLLVLKAMAEPEWKYTQGGFQGGVELPRNLAQRQGDCTDFTLELARQLLGQGFDVPDANKPNTTALFRNQARGFTQVPAWMARPGDIVVNRPKGHAGFFTGRDLKGHAHGIANNGSPAYPDVPGRDRPVGDFNFGPNPHFLRPIR